LSIDKNKNFYKQKKFAAVSNLETAAPQVQFYKYFFKNVLMALRPRRQLDTSEVVAIFPNNFQQFL